MGYIKFEMLVRHLNIEILSSQLEIGLEFMREDRSEI